MLFIRQTEDEDVVTMATIPGIAAGWGMGCMGGGCPRPEYILIPVTRGKNNIHKTVVIVLWASEKKNVYDT